MAKPKGELPPPDPERLARATALAQSAPLPARVGQVKFGTAGWTDPTLIKSHLFYPPGVSTPEARLRFYSTHFPLVEVDATYYTLLAPDVAERWLAWTPPEFQFNVKSYPVFTGHPIDIARLPSDLKAACQAAGFAARVYPDKLPAELHAEIEARFRAFLAPIIAAGRLGCVLLQFPPWLSATRGNARRFEGLRERLPGAALAVEFRNPSWLEPERRERVLELLSKERLAYVSVDEPGIPRVIAATTPELAIVRLHGQNVEGWQKRGATVQERFNYLYDPAELGAWVAPVRSLAQQAASVHVVFNNCVRNSAVLNAKDLAALLSEPGPSA